MAVPIHLKSLQRLIALCVLVFSTSVLAQDTGDVARRLVGDGIEAARAQDWLTARDRFQRAYDIQPLPLTLYNLAAAQEKTGDIVGADRSYRIFLRETVPGEHDDFRNLALQRRAALKEQVCYVVIEAPGIDSNDVLTLGEQELAHAVLGASIPSNPGTHTVRVRRAGLVVAEYTATLKPGGTERIALSVPVPVATAAPDGSGDFKAAPPSTSGPSAKADESTQPAASPPGSETQADAAEDDGSVLVPVLATGGIIAVVVIVAAAAVAGAVGGYYAYVTPAGDPTDSTLEPVTLGAP